jgi:hypothetical protein
LGDFDFIIAHASFVGAAGSIHREAVGRVCRQNLAPNGFIRHTTRLARVARRPHGEGDELLTTCFRYAIYREGGPKLDILAVFLAEKRGFTQRVALAARDKTVCERLTASATSRSRHALGAYNDRDLLSSTSSLTIRAKARRPALTLAESSLRSTSGAELLAGNVHFPAGIGTWIPRTSQQYHLSISLKLKHYGDRADPDDGGYRSQALPHIPTTFA